MRALFGDLCSGYIFRHDQEMRETLLDPNENETENSWNTAIMHGPQTSSEDGREIQDDVYDGEDKTLLEAQINDNASVLTIVGNALSQDMRGGDYEESGGSDHVSTMSTFLKADSDASHTALTQLVRLSPGSEPHGLRRRVDLVDYDGSTHKRPRLDRDRAGISPQTPDGYLEIPGSENASRPKTQIVRGISYYDVEDDVHRCQTCGWEVWRPSGVCTGCDAGEPAYHEVIDYTEDEGRNERAGKKSWSKRRDRHPRISLSSTAIEDDGEDYVKPDDHLDLIGPSWDGVSAYDSTSNAEENEYEMNSFIDDSSIHAEDADDSTRDQIDYKPLYEQLSSVYSRLEQEHDELLLDHEELKRDILGSDSDDSDETQFDVVNIEVQDPPISEVVLSQVQGDSQSSVVSSRRLRTRVDAFLAAPEGWHNISLMSTGDNHTEEEQEL
jgi:hypothetical protein